MATTHEIACHLKQLADDLLARPEYETNRVCDVIYLGYSSLKHDFLQFATHLQPCRKEFSDAEFRLSFGSGPTKLVLFGPRETVCRLVRPAEYDCVPLLSDEELMQIGGE